MPLPECLNRGSLERAPLNGRLGCKTEHDGCQAQPGRLDRAGADTHVRADLGPNVIERLEN